ncbi:Coenzyme Q-binding protein COQ10 A like [Actinidia chinensis var. chinensis]|uniref:Coenzyme Q-binding protein COQ10 A like n=1 Tax=Actinidia chinensis var. chinensis TaxID=1590841 RepID=A0A2R6QXY7_ACTCC|nr:Coenzyme Q-binding protein COQ10 A like [Actinidia chinensis var. chinensis]
MRSVVSTSKALGRLISRRNGNVRLTRHSGNYGELESCVPIRCLSGIVGTESMEVNKEIRAYKDFNSLWGNACSGGAVQRRGFLGCGDGDEGNVLSKVYEEKRVMGYSPEQLFAVVAAVDLYEDFLPWCQRSDIVRRHPDGSFDAELEIGFKFLIESYLSHVELSKPKFIKTTVSESNLFDHLINIWEFSEGPNPGTCNLHFFVDFKFRSPLYRQMASVFFKEVVSRLVGSFNDRCRLVYGPGVPVLENTYEQRT